MSIINYLPIPNNQSRSCKKNANQWEIIPKADVPCSLRLTKTPSQAKRVPFIVL